MAQCTCWHAGCAEVHAGVGGALGQQPRVHKYLRVRADAGLPCVFAPGAPPPQVNLGKQG
jgi:hypothetical protein